MCFVYSSSSSSPGSSSSSNKPTKYIELDWYFIWIFPLYGRVCCVVCVVLYAYDVFSVLSSFFCSSTSSVDSFVSFAHTLSDVDWHQVLFMRSECKILYVDICLLYIRGTTAENSNHSELNCPILISSYFGYQCVPIAHRSTECDEF